MKTWTTTVVALASAGLLLACGGTKPATTGDGTPGDGTTGDGTAKAGDGKKKKTELSDSDFQAREIEEVKAPTYLEGINHEAQDIFRQGVAAVLKKDSPPDYAGGLAHFKKATELDPAFLEAWFNIGQVYERMGKTEDALKAYQSALDKNPQNPSANAYIAKIYLGKARQAELTGDKTAQEQWMGKAKGLLDAVQASAPNDPAVNNSISLYYLMKDDLDTAEKYVKEVLYVEPTDVTALNTRGLINLKRGKFQIAKWIFEQKVLQQDPNSVEALTNLGYTYIKLNLRPLAMKYFKQALAQDQANMDVRMNIAAMLLEHLDYKQAHEHYSAVLAAEPLNIEAHEGLCDATFGLSGGAEDPKAQYVKAIECYNDYIKKRPDRTDLLKRIADTYQSKLQDEKGAIKYFEMYLKHGNLSAEDKDKIQKTLIVLREIEKKGGFKAMMAEPKLPEEGDGTTPPPDGAAPPGDGTTPPAAPEGGGEVKEGGEGAGDKTAAGGQG